MSVLTIRNVDPRLKHELRLAAARNGVSMEAQVRRILAEALIPDESATGFGTRLHALFRDLDDPGFEVPPRDELPKVPALDK